MIFNGIALIKMGNFSSCATLSIFPGKSSLCENTTSVVDGIGDEIDLFETISISSIGDEIDRG